MHATLEEFMAEIAHLSKGCHGIALVLFKGNNAHSYQYGLGTDELDVSARAFKEHIALGEQVN